jgi:AcrR family transcriptional regulator
MSVSRTGPGEDQRVGLREAQRRFARQHIRDAATEVFLELGYVASTVEDIIERAGASRRTFYAHYRGKVDVLVEAGADLVPEIQQHYRELDEALEVGSWEALHDWFAAGLEWRARYGALVAVWEQAAAVEAAQRDESRRSIEALPDCMPRYLGRWPKARRREARLRIVLLILQIGAYYNLTPPSEMDAGARALAAEALANIWYPALQAPSGASSKAARSRSPDAR